MPRYKTFVQAGGGMSAADLNALQDDLMSDAWRTIVDASGTWASAAVASTFPLRTDGGTMVAIASAQTGGSKAFHLDPTTNYAVTNRTIQCRVVGRVATSAVLTGINLTFGLYPLSSTAAHIWTAGAVVTGSQPAVFTAQALNTMAAAYSAAFTMPATGHYFLGVLTSATMVAAAWPFVWAALQVRTVT